jgi:hypothetical protein
MPLIDPFGWAASIPGGGGRTNDMHVLPLGLMVADPCQAERVPGQQPAVGGPTHLFPPPEQPPRSCASKSINSPQRRRLVRCHSTGGRWPPLYRA